jgi:small nuclear ribonucleoprotein (snRNP)-like protein
MATAMDNAEASFYLSQFIGKPLRIHVSDGRVFGGQMKCTDRVSIPILNTSLPLLLLSPS